MQVHEVLVGGDLIIDKVTNNKKSPLTTIIDWLGLVGSKEYLAM